MRGRGPKFCTRVAPSGLTHGGVGDFCTCRPPLRALTRGCIRARCTRTHRGDPHPQAGPSPTVGARSPDTRGCVPRRAEPRSHGPRGAGKAVPPPLAARPPGAPQAGHLLPSGCGAVWGRPRGTLPTPPRVFVEVGTSPCPAGKAAKAAGRGARKIHPRREPGGGESSPKLGVPITVPPKKTHGGFGKKRGRPLGCGGRSEQRPFPAPAAGMLRGCCGCPASLSALRIPGSPSPI